jgi:hypothetical protein
VTKTGANVLCGDSPSSTTPRFEDELGKMTISSTEKAYFEDDGLPIYEISTDCDIPKTPRISARR